LEALAENFYGFVDEYGATAIEQVNSGVSVLRPSVNRVVRFLDNDGSADAKGLELMERLLDDRSFAGGSSVAHCLAYDLFGLKGAAIASVHLDEQVRAQRWRLIWSKWKAFFVFPKPVTKRFWIVGRD
jgi:hypothetical protein